MAPRSSRTSGADTDTSMADVSEPITQLPVDPMVCHPHGGARWIPVL